MKRFEAKWSRNGRPFIHDTRNRCALVVEPIIGEREFIRSDIDNKMEMSYLRELVDVMNANEEQNEPA